MATSTVKAVPEGKLTEFTQTRTLRFCPLLCSEYSEKPDGTPPLIGAPESCANKSPPFGLGLGEGLPVGDGLGLPDGEGDGVPFGDPVGEGEGELVGDGDAVPLGLGVGEPVVTPKTPERIVVEPFETVMGIPFEITGTFCPLSVRMSIEAPPEEFKLICPTGELLTETVKTVPAGKPTWNTSVFKRRRFESWRYSDIPKGCLPLMGLPVSEASISVSDGAKKPSLKNEVAAPEEISGLIAQINAPKTANVRANNCFWLFCFFIFLILAKSAFTNSTVLTDGLSGFDLGFSSAPKALFHRAFPV